MKAVILAAGQGTRLRPLTDHQPKCMVEYKGQPIVKYILKSMENSGIDQIGLVTGYRDDVLKEYLLDSNLKIFHNPEFETTNMVHSLFCARDYMDDDLIVSYSDIIYRDSVLKQLVSSPHDVSVVVDKKWRELWELRMDDPLQDAETLKLNKDHEIMELGKKPRSYDDIQGQYIGLIKISRNKITQFMEFYDSLDKSADYDGKDFKNMYMTSLIQMMINELCPVNASLIDGGWLEIDSIEDLKSYENFTL